MIVKTTWHFRESPEVVWPLLCNSRMEPTHSCLFGLGVPQPKECRLPEGPGSVGSTRQCISDRGTIEQRILVWDEPRRLAFRMEQTDIYFKPCVPTIVEEFSLTPTDAGGTRATRTTRLEIIGWFRTAKGAMLWFGLKKVHRFVFRNWQRLAAEAARAGQNDAADLTIDDSTCRSRRWRTPSHS